MDTHEISFQDDFRKAGHDATAEFEAAGAPSNPTAHASSESLSVALADEDLDEEDDIAEEEDENDDLEDEEDDDEEDVDDEEEDEAEEAVSRMPLAA